MAAADASAARPAPGTLPGGYSLERAKASDADFLGLACVSSERAHIGRGIWDIVFGDDSKAPDEPSPFPQRVLTRVVADPEATAMPYHHSRFLVIRRASDGAPVASACAYASVGGVSLFSEASRAALTRAAVALSEEDAKAPGDGAAAEWTAEKCEEAYPRLKFVAESFPGVAAADGSPIPYDGAWMIEAVYTLAEERGKGLAAAVTKGALDAGKEAGCPNCIINTHLGNDGAVRVYERLGFSFVADGDSDACEAKLGVRGFKVLQVTY